MPTRVKLPKYLTCDQKLPKSECGLFDRQTD